MELTERLRKACDSLGAQRWPETTAVTGDREDGDELDPDRAVLLELDGET